MVYFRYWRGKKKGRYFGTLPSCVLAFLCYTILATQSNSFQHQGCVFTSVKTQPPFGVPRVRQTDCVAASEAMRFSVRSFGCALFYFMEVEKMPVFTILIIAVIAVAVILILKIATKKNKGFLNPSETCAICGKEIGLNRFKIGTTTDGKAIWKCADCAKKGGFLKIDYTTGKAAFIDVKDTEVRMKCNACGRIYCYSAEDIERNRQNAKAAIRNAISGMANAVGGTQIGARLDNSSAQNYLDKIVDFNKCPHCNSTDVRTLSKEEYAKEQQSVSAGNSSISSADELKKFKELLDNGVITQEEFDTKKKQLLGL